MTLVRPSRHDWCVATLFVVTLLLTWWLSRTALTGPFLFDDFPNFENLQQLSGCLGGDRIANYLAVFTGTPGRPLAALSFLIDDYAWPSTPYGWKRNNLLLHLLCGVFVFGLARTLAALRHRPSVANWTALGATAAWLLHPMQLSTSMLTVQRMTQLMTLISLAACWWVAHRLSRRDLNAWAYFRVLCFAAFMTVLAFLCKENGALLPLYLAATSYWVARNVPPDNARAFRAYLIALLLPVAAVVVYLAWSALHWQDDGVRNFTPWERLLTQSRIVWDYLRQILLPRMNGSGLFHDDIVVSRGLLSPASTLPAILGLIAIAAVCVIKHRSWPLLVFAVAWFLGGHLMESTTLPLELYFEHRNYLPMVGVMIAAGIAFASVPSKKVHRVTCIAVMAWLAMSAAMLWKTAPMWGSQRLLSGIWASEHPNSLRAVEMLAKEQFERGDIDTARKTLTDSMSKGPEFGTLAGHVLLIDCQIGQLTADDFDWATGRIGQFNRSTLYAMSMLRGLILEGRCSAPGVLDGWLRTMTSLMNHPLYRSRDIRGYMHVEFVHVGIHRRDYNMVISHMNAAFAASPSTGLALSIASVLDGGGYPAEAAQWRQRASLMQQDWPIPWWNWFKRVSGYQPNTCQATSKHT